MESTDAQIADLQLDDENPRLPEELKPRDPDSLIRHIANEYNTIEVATSMAEHGFFDSEPLIAIKKGGRLVVVEGNRRLTALKLLTDPDLRARIELDEASLWDDLSEEVNLEDTVPVLIAKNRKAVAPIIGYRHIAGIEPWEPWAKARFISKQIENEGLTFEETARIVGEKEADVRATYRNYRVAVDAEEKLHVSAREVKKKFGLFERAMNSKGIRDHIGAPAPSAVSKGKTVLKATRKKEVAEIFSWLFGPSAVITDSRKITELGQVLDSPDALKVLRETKNMEEALVSSGGMKSRVLKRLTVAVNALEKAENDLGAVAGDADVQDALDCCAEVIERMRTDNSEQP
jgi:hypothetical protein